MVNPALISALIQLGPAAYQMVQGIKQTREGKEMQKNLGARVNYEIPEAAKQALGVMQSLASSREMPGQSNLENKLDLSQAGALGNIAQSGAMSSQDMMAALTNLGGQRMMQEQDIAQSAAQDYQQRQKDLSGAYGDFAVYQESKQADRQQDWYERSQAAAAMRGAGMENTLGALQGLSSAAMSGLAMGMDAKKGVSDAATSVSSTFTPASDLPTKVDFTPMSGKNLINSMMQEKSSTAVVDPLSALRASQGVYTPAFGNKLGKNPSLWDEYQKKVAASPAQTMNSFNAGFFNRDLFNPIY